MSRSVNAEKRALRQARLNAFPQSGLTISEFCKEQNCSVASYYQWKRKLAGDDNSTISQAQLGNRFIQLMPQPAPELSDSLVELHLRSGSLVRVRGGSASPPTSDRERPSR
jgi:hypothetical protein